MANISLKHIWKRYPNGFEAVKDFNLEIADKEFIIFVGPSGCGKSTTLRMIAGLEEISEGELRIDGELMNDAEPKDRDISMVFQNYALYPHMTVYDNIAFGLKLRKTPGDEMERKVREAARILNLESLLDRKPRALSGGQRQRVAMGRAIVREPKVFLMDEPLSNLDAKLRVQMRVELARLHDRLNATIIYVTHDQVEAMTLGTRIVVMNDGVIQQIDTPRRLYQYPCNRFVAGFIGSPQMNFIDTVIHGEEGEVFAEAGGQLLRVDKVHAAALKNGYIGKRVTMGIRPEAISVIPQKETVNQENMVPAEINVYELLGDEALLYFDFAGTRMSAKARQNMPLAAGQTAGFVFRMEEAHFFDSETGKAVRS